MNTVQPTQDRRFLSSFTVDRRELARRLRRTGAVLGAVTMAVVLAACSGDSDDDSEARSSAGATSSVSEGATASPAPEAGGTSVTNESVTNETEPLCEGSPSQAEIDALPDGQVIVDGACDPDPSAPVGVYPGTTQETQSLGTVSTGEILDADCITPNGQERANSQEVSTAWVRVQVDGQEANIPEVWVHGEEDRPNC